MAVTIRDKGKRIALDFVFRAKKRHTTEILSQRYVATQVPEAARNGDIACLKELLGAGAEPRLGRRGS